MAYLINLLLLTMYRRRCGSYVEYSTALEAFVCARCIGQPTPAMWHAHKLARSMGPMPKAGINHVSPNFTYPGF